MNRFTDSFRKLGIRRGDLLLALSLFLLSAALGGLFLLNIPAPEYVLIKKDGAEVARLPLGQDCRYSIGDGNIIEISGGSVRMTYADCPDRICVKTGSISRSGQSIICAPHKVTVTIIGKNDTPSYDVITN
ncbi:MAG: NusG domain II-containing protein [Clostridia bacterium]|nr:NusG domain II-containing protein [Clostridia bacterium]